MKRTVSLYLYSMTWNKKKINHDDRGRSLERIIVTEKKQRNVTSDVIRGFAIITVIIGHCIQQGNGLEYYTDSLYWSNKLYQFIYSFHMPLFMILAGWFAFYSFSKVEGNRKAQGLLLGSRVVRYVLPIFLWTIFEYVRGYILNVRLGNETAHFPGIIPMFFRTFITNLWFLWAVLICFLIVYVMHFYLKDNIWVYLVLFLLMFVITDEYNLGVYKYMAPYYIGSFYVNMNKERLLASKAGLRVGEAYRKKGWLFVLISAVLFGGLFLFYRERAFIYLSGYKLSRATWLSQGVVDMYRMLIGFAGSVFFILLFDRLVSAAGKYKWPVLSAFGRNSLGIYILQGYYILMVMVNYTNDKAPSIGLVLIETVIIAVVSLLTTMLLDLIPVVRCLVGKPFLRVRNRNH